MVKTRNQIHREKQCSSTPTSTASRTASSNVIETTSATAVTTAVTTAGSRNKRKAETVIEGHGHGSARPRHDGADTQQEEQEAQEDPQQNAQEEDYARFDAISNSGKVIILENTDELMINRYLTDTEKQFRIEWNRCRAQIQTDYYNSSLQHTVSTRKQLLLERIVPPKFDPENATTRNTQGRPSRNPTNIISWNSFRDDVGEFTPTDGQILDSTPSIDEKLKFQVFHSSMSHAVAMKSESHEATFLESLALTPLSEANLVGDVKFSYHQSWADFKLMERIGQEEEDDENEAYNLVDRVMIEAKSTQNLLLPEAAVDVVARYDDGMRNDANEGQRSFNAFCKPLGQLFSYMLDSRTRYGALTSATRTYFVRFEDWNGKKCANVHVSGAWFVGEENYLKAWAYLYHLSCTNTAADTYNSDDVEWVESEFVPSSEDSDDSQSDSQSNSRNVSDSAARITRNSSSSSSNLNRRKGQRRRNEGSAKQSTAVCNILHSSFIPTVPYGSIKFLHSIGSGRNGYVYRALWEGREVAVKKFNGYPRGVIESFQKEKQAYERLRDAQGILIPKILFLAKSKLGSLFIGLQLGKKPKDGDDNVATELLKVAEKLKSQYGFIHTDVARRNCIYINDSKSKDRLVMIDLEEYELEGSKSAE